MGNTFRRSAAGAETNGRLADILRDLVDDDPSLAARLEAVGLDPSEVHDIRALDAVPVQAKDELVEARQSNRRNWAAPRIFQSPGPIYEVQPPGEDPWRWAQALYREQIEAGVVVVQFVVYH